MTTPRDGTSSEPRAGRRRLKSRIVVPIHWALRLRTLPHRRSSTRGGDRRDHPGIDPKPLARSSHRGARRGARWGGRWGAKTPPWPPSVLEVHGSRRGLHMIDRGRTGHARQSYAPARPRGLPIRDRAEWRRVTRADAATASARPRRRLRANDRPRSGRGDRRLRLPSKVIARATTLRQPPSAWRAFPWVPFNRATHQPGCPDRRPTVSGSQSTAEQPRDRPRQRLSRPSVHPFAPRSPARKALMARGLERRSPSNGQSTVGGMDLCSASGNGYYRIARRARNRV